MGLILGHGLVLITAGIAVGLTVSFVVFRLMPPNRLPNISARDLWTAAATSGLLALIALFASCIPAWRATRIDPLMALQTE